MERTFLLISALFFPWLVWAYYGKILHSLLAMILQVTVIGWPFASIWAFRLINKKKSSH